MAEWGRKEYSKKWPSRTPVWTWAAILLTVVFFAGLLTVKYMTGWTAAQKLYLTDYLKSGAQSQASPTASAKYTLLEGVVGKGQRLLIDNEIEPVTGPDGKHGWRLTDEGVRAYLKPPADGRPATARALATVGAHGARGAFPGARW